jgi:GTP-binding protein
MLNILNVSFSKVKLAHPRYIYQFVSKYMIKKFSTVEKSGAKILKVEIDENNNKKILFEDFDSNIPQSKGKSLKPANTGPIKLKLFGTQNDNYVEKGNENNAEEVEENLIKYDQYFSDFCRLYIKAGDGGNGSISIIKGPMFDDRTPQGGDGGKGGDIIFIADETVPSLSSIRRAHVYGNDGKRGMHKDQGGKAGKDIHINVPLGTIVKEIIRDEDFKYKKKDLRSDEYKTKFLVDMDQNGKQFIICKGGKHGIGNVTKRNLYPDSPCLKGKPGEEKELELVLKCYADVGLVGYPNAGKSTLLGALTRAVPKIAAYPFTTLFPHIGKLKFHDAFNLTIADLPGLIEGAHKNKGLGHKFLKHIERTKIVLFVLDGTLDPYEKRSPLNDLLSLFDELSLFNKSYLDKPYLIILNKSDTESENFKKNLELLSLESRFHTKEIISISAKYGHGLEQLSNKIRQLAEKINIKV